MATYLFTYRVPRRPLVEVLGDLDDTARAARIDAWNAWFERLGDHLVQRGDAVNDARIVGAVSAESRIGGYSVVEADTFLEAEELARGCPGIEWGGGVEIGEVVSVGTPAAASATARP